METEASREQAVRQELERVLSSSGFSRNERLSRFLRFLVERHLEGKGSELKESVIAVEVFGRKAGYDPKLDAIVRTEAVRLRARLEKYYQAEGSRDALIIELPKGGYRPVFRERATVAEERAVPAVPQKTYAPAGARRRQSWRIAAVVVAFVSLIALGITWWLAQADYFWRNPLAGARTERLTDFPGEEVDAAISPDGKFMAFLSDRAGPFDVWLNQVGTDEFVNVTKGKITLRARGDSQTWFHRRWQSNLDFGRSGRWSLHSRSSAGSRRRSASLFGGRTGTSVVARWDHARVSHRRPR